MSGDRGPAKEHASACPQGGGDSRSLNLIHTNNSPKSMPMRVPARFMVAVLRFSIHRVRDVLWFPANNAHHLPGGPLAWLWMVRLTAQIDSPLRTALLGRALHAKSTW